MVAYSEMEIAVIENSCGQNPSRSKVAHLMLQVAHQRLVEIVRAGRLTMVPVIVRRMAGNDRYLADQ